MPPIHPAIVHFPIALLVFSVLADLLGYLFQINSLKSVGWWSLIAAAVGAALAVLSGLYDMNREDIKHDAHKRVHTHLRVGLILSALIVLLTVWRWFIYSDAEWEISWLYLIFGLLILGLGGFQGWLGSELVYGYGVGVAPTGQGTEPARQAKERVEDVIGEIEDDKHEH